MATTRGCSRRSPRWPRHSWACWPATGYSRTGIGGPRPLGLALWGLACLGLGTMWGRDFPIIKILWTSTFVLVAGGWSLLLLALFYTIIDVLKFRAWAFFFVVIGVNAITIYVAADIIPFDEISEHLPGRRRPALGIVWTGGRADRHRGDRVADAASSVPKQDLPAGLNQDEGASAEPSRDVQAPRHRIGPDRPSGRDAFEIKPFLSSKRRSDYRRAGRAGALGAAAQVEQTSRPRRVTPNSNVGWRHSGQTAASTASTSGSHTHSSRPTTDPAPMPRPCARAAWVDGSPAG